MSSLCLLFLCQCAPALTTYVDKKKGLSEEAVGSFADVLSGQSVFVVLLVFCKTTFLREAHFSFHKFFCLRVTLPLFFPEIASSFGKGVHFNTFGGNPVACAIGSAVLDVSSVCVQIESFQHS